MLVLLAILMVTAPVLEYEENINLPQGSRSSKVRQIKKIDILVTKDRKISVNKSEHQFSSFADSFVLFAQDQDRNIPIHIRADQVLKYKDIVFILKTVKEAGFYKVSLITDG
ncbi:Biopolymer transport protein ExbD/TolR [hydrothermal vent metagenome]|uniref:Biopolymer transport protein ExbD/TolR n=1 Tax=hydrothermal vent metagenome TaxID=652676 RepID=A0A3B1E4C7_9ZZZZ